MEKQKVSNRTWLSRVRDEIAKRCAEFDKTIGMPYYHFDEDGGVCADGALCRKCLHKKHGNHASYEGGYIEENDSPVCCNECGVLLDYTLTDYGAESEIEHFENGVFNWDDPQECYEMERVINTWLGMGAWSLSNIPIECRKRLFKVLRDGANLPAHLQR